MIALLWMVTWLPRVLPAMTDLPAPVNLTLSSDHFMHMLAWEAGPETPAGVYYQVSVCTESGSWKQVSGCEHVQHPLLCDLTQAFPNPRGRYFTQVTALMDGRTPKSVTHKIFTPINNTKLDLPLLKVTPCDGALCVDLHPPLERLRAIYKSLQYKLRIKYNNEETEQYTEFLRRRVLENLAPGRKYCVSIRFSDEKAPRKSNYSQPVCAVTPATYNTDALISGVLCGLVVAGLLVVALLVALGYICLRRRTLPLVLTSTHHIEGTVVISPCSVSLSALVIDATPPSSGEKWSSQTSDDSDEESMTETSAGGGAREDCYTQRPGTNLLSSSSSSSSLLAPLPLKPQPAQSASSNQTLEVETPAEKRCGSGASKTDSKSEPESNRTASPPPADAVTAGRIQEQEEDEEENEDKDEEENEEEDNQGVNLLTLTFGREEEEEETADDESSSASVLPAQTCKTQQAASETVSCSVNKEEEEEDEDEEEEEEEEDEDSGYIGRPSTRVLQKLL